MDELVSKKINELISFLKENDINENLAVERVKELFSDEEYKHIFRKSFTDFYIENKEIIRLSPNNETKIVISYPEGDRLGNRIADYSTNIWIEYLNHDYLERLPLFEYNQVDEHKLDIIQEKTEELLKEIKPTKQYVLNYLKESLKKYPPVLPTDLIERTEDKILLDNDVKSSIIDGMEKIASYNAEDAYDQYQYGHNGGSDVEYWEMQKCEQFRKIKLPDNIKNLYRNDIEDVYVKYPEAEKILLEHLNNYSVQLNSMNQIKDNKDLIFSYLKARNEIAVNYYEFTNMNFEWFQIHRDLEESNLDYKIDYYYNKESRNLYLDENLFLKPLTLETISNEIENLEKKISLTKKTMNISAENLNQNDLSCVTNNDDMELEQKIDNLDEQINNSLKKLDNLSNQKIFFFQVNKKKQVDAEKQEIENDIKYNNEFKNYLFCKLIIIHSEQEIDNLNSIKEQAKSLNSKLPRYDKNILQTLGSFEDIPYTLVNNPYDYQSIIDNKLSEIDNITQRLNEICECYEYCNEIKKQEIIESQENGINEEENDQYEEQEDEYELEI